MGCCFGKSANSGGKEDRNKKAESKFKEHLTKECDLSPYVSPTARSIVTENGDNFYDCAEQFTSLENILIAQDSVSSPKFSKVGIRKSQDASCVVTDSNPNNWQQVAIPTSSTVGGGFIGASESSEDPSLAPDGIKTKFVGCLALLDSLRTSFDEDDAKKKNHRQPPQRHGLKMQAGASLQERPSHVSPEDAREMWDACSSSTFVVRGPDYMRSKAKVQSEESIYRCIGMDLLTFDTKQTHIASLINLPHVPTPPALTGPDAAIPSLLIFNIMLPTYQPSLFGSCDGHGNHIVFYFALPEDFDPRTFPNQAALGLLRRFSQNGREADGTATRDRLKLIPRVANVDEWAMKGPLTLAEHRLLSNYNGKPIMTRPQHHFFKGQNYMEVDLDIHVYMYLARKAILSYMDRLQEVVWECGFVLQGNAPEELQEQLLGCARIYRNNFRRERPLVSFLPQRGPSMERVEEAVERSGGDSFSTAAAVEVY